MHKKTFVILILITILLLILVTATRDPIKIRDENSKCAIYKTNYENPYKTCPENQSVVMTFTKDYFNTPYGSHFFPPIPSETTMAPYTLCCKNIQITSTAPETKNHTLFTYTKYTQDYFKHGLHVFATGIKQTSKKILNIVSKLTTCQPGTFCITKVNKKDFHKYGSHIFSCNTNSPLLKSICYKPIPNCQHENQTCNPENLGQINPNNNLRCVGEIRNNTAHCCKDGFAWQYNKKENKWKCRDFKQCGFTRRDQPCFLPGANATSPGPLFHTRYYFQRIGCFNLVKRQSCCFNTTKNGYTGNYYCPLRIETVDQIKERLKREQQNN